MIGIVQDSIGLLKDRDPPRKDGWTSDTAHIYTYIHLWAGRDHSFPLFDTHLLLHQHASKSSSVNATLDVDLIKEEDTAQFS